MAGETKVFLQAASDAWMGAEADITSISITNYGSTATVPIVQMSNGLCIPDGTNIQIADSKTPALDGNIYQASNTQGTGGTSYFNGNAFYLRDTDGSALGSDVEAQLEQGKVLWFFDDDDPRKMYGLPYHYVSHSGTHQQNWTDNTLSRSRKYAVRYKLGPGLTSQELRYRTKWDYIAPSSSSEGGGMVPGYGFADRSDVFKQAGSIVTKCEAVSGGGLGYEAIITTSRLHWAEVGDLFTTRDFNVSKLANLSVNIGGSNVTTIPDVTSIFKVYSVLDGLTFTAHKTAGSGYLALDCIATGTAASGTSRGAKVVFTGKATHADDFFQRPARMPTTTRFQLNVTDISHTFTDLVTIVPMMKTKWDGTLHEQIQTLGYSVGLRKEAMKFQGTLVDRGPISTTNPRKQVLMNICRTQWLKISGLWGGKNDGSKTDGYTHSSPQYTDFRGRGNSGPTNPRSYPCITIYDPSDQSSSDNTKVDLNPDGGYNIYRGIIKNMSFTQAGGRPDIWDWSMDFVIMSNEKPSQGPLDYKATRED